MVLTSSYGPGRIVGVVSGRRHRDIGSVYELEAKIVPDFAKTAALALGAANAILV